MSHPLHLVQEFGPPLRGLVHVGANIGQEFADYVSAGLAPVVYVEADPRVCARLAQSVGEQPGHFTVNALCASTDGEMRRFNVASNDGNSSSMLDFGWHSEQHPDVTWSGAIELETTRLDTLFAECATTHPDEDWSRVDALVLDVQGAEMHVLGGAPRLLEQVRCIWSEVNEGGLYRGDCSVDEVCAFLRPLGFRMKHLAMNRHGWGDALFMRPAGPR
jgi:FkbM family methyltransferase